MSNTPKCDAEGTELVTIEFARQIEREKEKWREVAGALADIVKNRKECLHFDTEDCPVCDALKRFGAMEG